jgi:hypothetical protein
MASRHAATAMTATMTPIAKTDAVRHDLKVLSAASSTPE